MNMSVIRLTNNRCQFNVTLLRLFSAPKLHSFVKVKFDKIWPSNVFLFFSYNLVVTYKTCSQCINTVTLNCNLSHTLNFTTIISNWLEHIFYHNLLTCTTSSLWSWEDSIVRLVNFDKFGTLSWCWNWWNFTKCFYSNE